MKPDYAGRGLVNLVQSIATACGSGNANYPELIALPADALADARHVLLLVIDGLGQKTLDFHPECRNLRRHCVSTLTSVFPSTTASAITSVMTGLAPAQHALTGWHMHMDEIDQTLAILPLTPRCEPPKHAPEDLPPLLFEHSTLFAQLDRESWVVAPQKIAGSPFNAWHARGASVLAYESLPEMFTQIAGLLNKDGPSRFIYAYYSDLDTVSHRFGTDSPQARAILAGLDMAFGEFTSAVQGSDAWLITTADHGFIDSPGERVINLYDHPQLAALLARPLCGERRVAYCYVAQKNRPAFAAYVQQHLAQCADLRLSSELIEEGWFGPPPFHARLASRVGDYTLLMKDDWTIKDWLPGEKPFRMLGVHGGASRDEMEIPLIVLKV